MSTFARITFIITTLVYMAIFIFFVIAPFKSKLRFTLRVSLLLFVAYGGISLPLCMAGYQIDSLTDLFGLTDLLIWFGITIVFFYIIVKTNLMELLFSIFIIFDLQANALVATRMIRSIIERYCFYPGALESYRFLFGIPVLIVLFVPVAWFIFIKLLKRVVELKIDFRNWRFLWFLPLLFYVYLLISGFGGISRDFQFDFRDVATLTLLNLVSYTAYVICLQTMIRTYESLKTLEHTRIMEHQLFMQKSQYERLTQGIQSVYEQRRKSHEHLLIMKQMSQAGAYDQLDQYLNSYFGVADSLEEMLPVCINRALNTILCHYMAIARDKGIKISVSVDLANELPISDIDLCIVFGNLVENAIEACERQQSGEKYIKIRGKTQGRQIFLLVRNSFEGVLQREGEILYSSKRKGEGIGISSVRNIVERNGGSLQIGAEEHEFQVHARIHF